MRIPHTLITVFAMLWLQACSTVEGPVHFYSGQPRVKSETARLKVPAPITVVKVDGREIEVPSKSEGFYEIYLLPGVHRIDFKYELSWGDNVSGRLVKSDVVGIESQLYAGKDYELTYPVPTEMEEAYQMSRKFEAQLVEKDTGRKIASRPLAELNKFRSKPIEPVQRGDAIQTKGIAVTTAEPMKVAVPTDFNTDIGLHQQTSDRKAESKAGSTKAVVPADINAENAVHEDSVKRLKFWFLMANEKERKLFKKWMKSIEGENAKE